MERYRINQKMRIGGGWLTPCEIVPYTEREIWVDYQHHKLGGWCKWSEVKEVMSINEKIKEQRKAMSLKLSHYEAKYGKIEGLE